MSRFVLVCCAVAAIIGLTLLHRYAPALAIGLVAGVIFFLRGIAAGGALGNARRFGRGPADMNSRVGVFLAAMGIAAEALGHDPPFPMPFLIFYGVCQGVAGLAALVLTGRTAWPAGGKDKRGG